MTAEDRIAQMQDRAAKACSAHATWNSLALAAPGIAAEVRGDHLIAHDLCRLTAAGVAGPTWAAGALVAAYQRDISTAMREYRIAVS